MAAYTDDFSGTLADWTIEVGTWDTVSGDLRCQGGGSFPSWIRYDLSLDSKDHYCEVDWKTASSSTGFIAPAVNVGSADTSGYHAIFRSFNSQSQIIDRNGFTGTVLIDSGVGTGPPATIRLERDGSFLKLYDDGVEVASYELTGTTKDTTQVGLAAHHTTTSTADNFSAGDLGAGGTTIDAGQATETDTALPITPIAGAIATVGQASETNTAQAITPTSGDSVAVGQASQTDTALPVTAIAGVIASIGQATESNTAQPLTAAAGQVQAIGQATEANTAQVITPLDSATVVAIGTASETSEALSITPVASVVVEIGQASETSAALPVESSNGALVATCKLVDVNGNALPNLENLSYAWFDESDPADFTTPLLQGAIEDTDASGRISIDLTGTTLTAGQTGTLVLRSQDGTLFGAYNLAAAA